MCCDVRHRAGIDVGDWLWQAAAAGWWLLARVVAPTVVVTLVLSWRWLSGAAMTGRALPSTFLRGAPAPGPLSWRRPRWACWPGWCRAVARWVASTVATGLMWWPAVTVGVVALVVAGLAGYAIYRRRAVARAASEPVPDFSRPALGPAPVIPLVWDAELVQAAR